MPFSKVSESHMWSNSLRVTGRKIRWHLLSYINIVTDVGKTRSIQTSGSDCFGKRCFTTVKEGNFLFVLHFESWTERSDLPSRLRVIKEIWFIHWSLKFLGDLVTLNLTRRFFSTTTSPRVQLNPTLRNGRHMAHVLIFLEQAFLSNWVT